MADFSVQMTNIMLKGYLKELQKLKEEKNQEGEEERKRQG